MYCNCKNINCIDMVSHTSITVFTSTKVTVGFSRSISDSVDCVDWHREDFFS